MRTLTAMMSVCGFLIVASFAWAQRPGADQGSAAADDLVTRMMGYDKDKDGTLTRSELTDERLHRLFDRADANKDGTVTKEELTALAARERGNDRRGPMMGPPRPGEILPMMLQDRLNLTSEQRSQLDALQKVVDEKLETILTDEQKAQLKEMRQRRPGGPGPPGGGRPGGGGPPPPRDDAR